MKRLIVAVVLLMLALPALAEINVGAHEWSKLTDSQKADILKQIAVQGEQNVTPAKALADPKKVGEWVDVGAKIGTMIGGAAKEVGVAVNEFVKTPVGMMTMGLIVWHYMGGVLVHVFGGLLTMAVGFSFVLLLMRRSVQVDREYDKEKTDVFGRAKLLSIRRGSLSDDAKVGYTVAAAVVLGVSLITMFSF